jgi:hypothetical protein
MINSSNKSLIRYALFKRNSVILIQHDYKCLQNDWDVQGRKENLSIT